MENALLRTVNFALLHVEELLVRVPFESIFETAEDGAISARCTIHVSGLTVGPGMRCDELAFLAGYPVACIWGRDLEVEQQGQTIVIQGFY